MAKTKLAKKRRLQRARAHQAKTYTSPGVLKGEVVYQRAQQPDPWPDQKSESSSVGYAVQAAAHGVLQRAASRLTGVTEKERVAIALADLQAEVAATGEAHIIVTQQHSRASTPATMSQLAESHAAARAAEQPTRATCPECNTRQKVRTDGTFGKHRTTLASDPLEAVDCAGTGQPWNAIGHDGGAI